MVVIPPPCPLPTKPPWDCRRQALRVRFPTCRKLRLATSNWSQKLGRPPSQGSARRLSAASSWPVVFLPWTTGPDGTTTTGSIPRTYSASSRRRQRSARSRRRRVNAGSFQPARSPNTFRPGLDRPRSRRTPARPGLASSRRASDVGGRGQGGRRRASLLRCG